MRQRVAIARAIVCESDVLIMDEPTASLDAITKEVIQEQILKPHKTHGMALVLVTHDIEEAVFLGRQIFIIKESQNYRHYRQHFLAVLSSKNSCLFMNVALR